jgi:hypothetical protein
LPGRRVYMHGAGEGKSEEECVWSVWEVDGEIDTVSRFTRFLSRIHTPIEVIGVVYANAMDRSSAKI